MLSDIGNDLAVKQSPQDFNGFGETSLSYRSWIEGQTDCCILCERMTRADTYLKATLTQVVDACKFLGQMDGLMKVVVQDERTHPDPGCCIGNGHKRCEWGPPVGDVIPRVEHVESRILGSSGL
jgi:hypothetical protein